MICPQLAHCCAPQWHRPQHPHCASVYGSSMCWVSPICSRNRDVILSSVGFHCLIQFVNAEPWRCGLRNARPAHPLSVFILFSVWHDCSHQSQTPYSNVVIPVYHAAAHRQSRPKHATQYRPFLLCCPHRRHSQPSGSIVAYRVRQGSVSHSDRIATSERRRSACPIRPGLRTGQRLAYQASTSSAIYADAARIASGASIDSIPSASSERARSIINALGPS